MLAYCRPKHTATAPNASLPSCPGCGTKSLTYGLPWSSYSPVSLEAMEEDPDNRPYIWDLEEACH
jgi:hypothetical protein